MSARSRAASWAQKRAIANPFQPEMPTSPPKDADNSRIRSTSASSPGTISAVPIADAAFGDRRAAELFADIAVEPDVFGEHQPAAAAEPPAVDEFALPACARPSRRGRTPRFRRAAARRCRQDRYRFAATPAPGRTGWSPAAARQDARPPQPSALYRAARPALRRGRSFPPPPWSPSSRDPSPAAISMPNRSPPATPPAVLTNTADRPSASGEGKRTRSEPDSCRWRRRVSPST